MAESLGKEVIHIHFITKVHFEVPSSSILVLKTSN